MDEATRQKLINSLKDIHGYVEIQVSTLTLTLFWLLILIPIAYFIYKKYFEKKEEVIKTELEIIVETLQNLEKENKSEKFYLNYSEQTRKYLDYRYGCDCMDKTTKEIEKIIYNFPEIDTSAAKQLIRNLNKADLAKFAKKDFSHEDRMGDLNYTLYLIDKVEEKFKTEEEQTEKEKEEEEIKI